MTHLHGRKLGSQLSMLSYYETVTGYGATLPILFALGVKHPIRGTHIFLLYKEIQIHLCCIQARKGYS